MMRTTGISAACLLLAFAGSALADFTGPAPLAWRWVEPTEVAPSGSPVVDGNDVYLAVGRRMFCVDRLSGNMKWRYPLDTMIDGFFRSGILVHQGVAMAAADNRTLYGVDAQSGDARWQYVSNSPFVGGPVAVSRYVVIRLDGQTVIAIDPENGEPFWKDQDGLPQPLRILGNIGSQIAAHGSNFLVFTQAGELRAYDIATRRISWQVPFRNVTPGTNPVVFQDTVFVNSGTFVVALDATNGRTRWQTNVRESLVFSPTTSSEGVMVVTRTNRAIFLDRNGREIGSPIQLESQPRTQPSAAGPMFVVAAANGSLNLIDPNAGEIAWTYFISPLTQAAGSPGGMGMPGGPGTPGGPGAGGGASRQQATPGSIPAAGPPVIANGTLLVLGTDGSLLAFDRQLGVDLEGPRVDLVWPMPGAQISGRPPLEFFFRIEDEAGGVKPSTINITINGQRMEHEWGRDGFAIVRISNVGRNRPLTDGRKTIEVTVSDWLGNETVKRFTVFVDNSLSPLPRPTGGAAGGIGGRGGIGGGPDGE